VYELADELCDIGQELFPGSRQQWYPPKTLRDVLTSLYALHPTRTDSKRPDLPSKLHLSTLHYTTASSRLLSKLTFTSLDVSGLGGIGADRWSNT
jgi:hypothetical protein